MKTFLFGISCGFLLAGCGATGVDTTPPVIKLTGSTTITIEVGNSYTDAGASATDDVDGDLTPQLVIDSNLDLESVGDYTIRYNVVDSAGNAADEVVRQISVVESRASFEFWSAKSMVTIKSGSGGFTAPLDSADRFSRDHDLAGDIDGDGVPDLVVGARSDDDGATDAGAVYILFMQSDGNVHAYQKISMLSGGFTDVLVEGNFFGYGVAGIGDHDGDDIPDVAVSAPGAASNQALYVLHLNANGTVKNSVKNSKVIAQGLSAIGDLNGDNIEELVACDPMADDGGVDRGAVNIVFIGTNGLIQSDKTVRISSTSGGFGDGLTDGDQFGGREVAMLGDLDKDGTQELAVGAFLSDEGRGAIWILSLDPKNNTVVSKQKIGSNTGGFAETLPNDSNPNGTIGAQFGHAMAAVGDLNGDGINDLFTGANQYNEGYAYILYLNTDKTVKSFSRINNSEGGFNLDLAAEERFSRSISFAGDIKGDGTQVINVGGGAGETGTLYSLNFMKCTIDTTIGNNYWANGSVLFSNWDHASQTVTEALSLEQCLTKSFELEAPNITVNPADNRCIISTSDSTLTASSEGSVSYMNTCW